MSPIVSFQIEITHQWWRSAYCCSWRSPFCGEPLRKDPARQSASSRGRVKTSVGAAPLFSSLFLQPSSGSAWFSGIINCENKREPKRKKKSRQVYSLSAPMDGTSKVRERWFPNWVTCRKGLPCMGLQIHDGCRVRFLFEGAAQHERGAAQSDVDIASSGRSHRTNIRRKKKREFFVRVWERWSDEEEKKKCWGQ